MALYVSLDDAPLPETIYDGPLENRIVPLVKAITVHGITTSGSCEGHIHTGDGYPWVQFFAYDDARLLEYLVRKHSERDRVWNVQWTLAGNVVQPLVGARDITQLHGLQNDADLLADFLFEYRPEVLDPESAPKRIGLPDPADPEWVALDRAIEAQYDLLLGRTEASPSDWSAEVRRMQELHRQEVAYMARSPRCLEIPATPTQMGTLLEKATALLGP